jgi:two-component system, chemotaxis family, response regulator PixG
MVMTPDRVTEGSFAQSIAELKQSQFTGCLTVNPIQSRTPSYQLYFLLGRLLYATGGKHVVRRWWRHCTKHASQLDPGTLQKFLEQNPANLGDFWEYELLYHLRKLEFISPDETHRIILGVVGEVFLSITLHADCQYQCQEGLPTQKLQKQLVLLDPAVLIEQHQVGAITPFIRLERLNQAPVIRQTEKLKSITSPSAYQTLSSLLDGHRNFWDLVSITGRRPQEVLGSLQMQIESGIIELTEIPDLERPVSLQPPAPKLVTANPAQLPLIACVDDSAWVCQTLSELITKANYRFLSIQDPLRAIPTLLSQKPNLILLDLRMPNTNGYEICTQLRRLSAFANTPILILTGNDGVVDRVRAKMVGATDFLSKTISHDQLLATLAKHLAKPESVVS